MDSSISASTFKRIRVFAIGTPEECRALSWGFRQLEAQSLSPEVTEANLSDLSAAHKEADFVVCFVDLGQPVPTNALIHLAKQTPGAIVFTQPTPTQLLSVFDLPNWSALTWDGSSPEILCVSLNNRMSAARQLIRQRCFVRDTVRILAKSKSSPSYLEWINPTPGRSSLTQFPLNQHQMVVTVGSDQSRSTIELPTPSKGALLELRYNEGRWIPKGLDPCVSMSGDLAKRGLAAGDTIKLGDFILAARLDESVKNLNAILDQESEWQDHLLPKDEKQSFTDFLQGLLVQSATGVIHLSAGLRRATICLHMGSVDQVYAGPVSGEKALERVLTWQNLSWKFVPGDFSLHDEPSLKILSTDFSIFCDQVRRDWERVTALVPPMNISLDVDPSKFARIAGMGAKQSKVLAAVSEFRLVRDILNYCPLRDLEIYDELINFRKSGLIRISK